MDTDLMLVVGMVLAVFSVPAMISAYSDGRSPRAPMLILLIAGGLFVYAISTHPGGYTMAQIPDVFFGVVARILP